MTEITPPEPQTISEASQIENLRQLLLQTNDLKDPGSAFESEKVTNPNPVLQVKTVVKWADKSPNTDTRLLDYSVSDVTDSHGGLTTHIHMNSPLDLQRYRVVFEFDGNSYEATFRPPGEDDLDPDPIINRSILTVEIPNTRPIPPIKVLAFDKSQSETSTT